jgi:hypothetical protein
LHVNSQSSWGSFEIGGSGCTAYFPYAPEWELSLAEDSSLVWVGEANEGDPWVVMTWIDPFNMAVLYIYSTPENSPFQNKEFFFNSFRFPEY